MVSSTRLLLPVIYFTVLLVILQVNLSNACGGVLDGDLGTITSPNYPNFYPDNAHCIWDIVAPRKALFTLSFMDFNLLSYSCADSVKVYSKVSLGEDWKRMKNFCGYGPPPNVTFEGRKMRIEFLSTAGSTNKGFSAKYSFIESEALNELQSSPGSRVSITYSVLIGTDVDLKRTWTLKVPVNSSLYNIMETVQKLDSRQQVEYNVIDGKPFVSSVMGIQDDVETGFYWFTFLRKHNAEESMLVEDSPVDVKIEANQELILWYKSGQWTKP